MKTATEHLTQYGIRPSVQRVAVMKYLLKHRTHPTVDEIYAELSKEIPTLSKTTVYNTLQLLLQHKAVLELSIDPKMAHYDGYPEAHSHFMCSVCKKIYDMKFDASLLRDIMPGDGFMVDDIQLYYSGICPECKKNNY